MLKKITALFLILIVSLTVLAGCETNEAEKAKPKEENIKNAEQPKDNQEEIENKTLILSTTTSTENSGLLDYILPDFKEKTGIETKVVAVGTGKALQMGMDGEADVLLVHAKPSEEKFVNKGHGTERFDVMYNDFVIIGPKDDPADIYSSKDDVIYALKAISDTQSKFVSRGDNSGTHKKEKSLWEEAGVAPEGEWYVSAGKGMGDVIQMANEMLAYTLTDRATYLSMMNNLDLVILSEGDSRLFNQYGVIPVNPNKNDKINSAAAQAFIDWLLSNETQIIIGEFGKDKFGQPLFIPNAK